MNGWTGTILRVDLTTGRHEFERPGADTYQRWIGGKGLAGHFLRPACTLPWDDPVLPLLFMAGPLVGTASPTSGRMCIMSKAPLTGTVGDTSVGGGLGTALKRAGLDGIVVTGRSPRLCGLEITDHQVRICDASDLAGMGTAAATRRLAGKGAVAVTGPAADSGVRFANIMVDGSYAGGRTGIGLVAAARNLKYVTVKGTGTLAVCNMGALKKAREDIFRQIAASPILFGEQGIVRYGTGAIYDLIDSRHMMPTANFRRTRFEQAKAANAPAYEAAYHPGHQGCRGCHIRCKRVTKGGVNLPEFETMSHFGPLLENADIDIVVRANTLCNELGMDTISAASTLACYAEVRGAPLDGDLVLSLLEDIGHGRGAGRQLGQGAAAYAAAAGHPEAAMTVKGLELPAYDPRGAYGMALGYVTSTRGGCHLRAYPISHEIVRKPVATDRFSFAGKARIIKIAEDLNAVVDSLTACKFVFFATSAEEYAQVYTAVTGLDITGRDLLRIGERIFYQERIINALNGFTSKDDDLPSRFFTEPGTGTDSMPVPPLSREDFLQARARYYCVRGLDEDGRPTPGKARELELDTDTAM